MLISHPVDPAIKKSISPENGVRSPPCLETARVADQSHASEKTCVSMDTQGDALRRRLGQIKLPEKVKIVMIFKAKSIYFDECNNGQTYT